MSSESSGEARPSGPLDQVPAGPSAHPGAHSPAQSGPGTPAQAGARSPVSATLGGAGQVDWDALRSRARELCSRAYAPYSHFPVGAAGLASDGRIVTGCNVENASYGMTLCAECGMVSDLIAGGGGRLVAVTCCNGRGEQIMPCGRCRQLLWEHGGPDLQVDTPEGVLPMSAVLPQAFDSDALS